MRLIDVREYPLACGMPLPEPLERQGLASPGSRERLRFHHAYGYASLTVGSFKPHTTIMQWWPLDRRFTESVRRPEGGRHWVLHACCPYPHTKSAVRILHKPLMQSSLIMRPATVLYKPSRDIVHGLFGGVIPLPIRFPVRIFRGDAHP